MKSNNRAWLITGVAGFIGSNLLLELLQNNCKVVGIDSFITGKEENLEYVKSLVSKSQWNNFTFFNDDLRDHNICQKVTKGIDIILHQAALGSVPRSVKDPILSSDININGFLNIIDAARLNNVNRLIYASSSSVYGDSVELPKVEDVTGNVLSPYALTKLVNEEQAKVFSRTYGIDVIGLRYFNVFGSMQDPNGEYAAVIPKWINSIMNQVPIEIFGDGNTSRDFCYIKNVIQANLLAATTDNPNALNQIYNVAFGGRTSLNDLFNIINTTCSKFGFNYSLEPKYKDFRPGDIKHSNADISKIKKLLNYDPIYDVSKGLSETIRWYVES
jgi:UDP-N-acetylglucosamine 4-epimerase